MRSKAEPKRDAAHPCPAAKRHTLAVGASGAAAMECEEAGRLMVHAVSLAAGRASIRNVTLLTLRRRLRELPCDLRPLIAVLPGASAVAAAAAAAAVTTASPSPVYNASAANASVARALRRRSL